MGFKEDFSFGTKESKRLQPPSDYKVILLNDDYTTKDFVVDVLKKIFHKEEAEAVRIMETVHRSGSGVAGIYAYDIARTRAKLTMQLATKEGFPLQCKIEKVP